MKEDIEETEDESLRDTMNKAASDEAVSYSEEVAVEETPAIEAPEHWSQLDRDRFSELPDDLKPLWLEKSKSLETGYNEKFERVASWEKQQARLNEIFQPVANELALHGVDQMDMVQRLIGAHQYLRNDPAAGLRWLAEQYGAQHLLADDDGFYDPDPKITQLEQQVAQLSNAFNGFQGTYQSSQQAQAQAHIDAFAGAVDESGNPKHPYFNDVRAQMGQLMAGGAASTIEQAYDMAVWALPESRQRLMQAEQAKAAKDAEAKRKAEAEKARRAADARVTSSGRSGSDAKHGTLREAVTAAVRG